jgi:hypothetical protein
MVEAISVSAKASGRSRTKVEAHIAIAAPINFAPSNVRFTARSAVSTDRRQCHASILVSDPIEI